ncbi:MAG: aliphatic sulfonate ABC transporter substrate-binding protein [Acidobacteriota bacterium]
MKRNSYIKIASIVALLALFGGLAFGQLAVADNSANKVIRVGYFPNLTHSQALVGLGDGTFKRALGPKISIEEHQFNAGPAEIEALLAGELDLGYIGPVPTINGFVQSKGQLQIIAGASDAGAVLVARKGSNIKAVKDLDGKKVAVPQLGNTQDISLRNLLAQAKLKDASKGGTVTIIPAENADILTLIGKGEVDAALVPEPWGSRIVKEAGASIALNEKQVWRNGQYATAVVIVSKEFLTKNPDLVKKWLQAHVELTQRINAHKDIAAKVVNSQIKKLTQKGIADDVLKSSFNRIVITYDPKSDSIRDFVKLSKANGYIKENPDVNKLINLSILNQVLKAKKLPPVK